MQPAPPTVMMPSNTNTTNRRRTKKKKSTTPSLPHSISQRKTETQEKWRSEKQQQLYSSKLIHALNNLHLNSTTTPPSTSRRGRSVREAADRALAASARGRTRWSRAILTSSRIMDKFRKHHNRRRSAAVSGGGGREGRKARVSVMRLRGKGLASVRRKVKMLGRLVPGCRKQPAPVVLEEAADYIAALEMQVGAMTALTNLLSGSTR